MRPRPIVAGTDFSRGAQLAVSRATGLADDLDLPLQLAHVVDGSTAAPRTPLPKQWRTSLVGRPIPRGSDMARFELAGKQLDKVARGRGVQRIVRRHGKAHEELIRAARSANARLLVVGAHRPRKAMERFLLGTTAERVLRGSSQAVLIVRRPSNRRYRNVLAPIDFSSVTPRQLAVLREVVPDARVTLLHAIPEAGERVLAVVTAAERRARRLALDAGFPRNAVNVVVEQADPREAILRAERRLRPNLVVVGTRGRKGLGRMLLGSVAEHVIRGTSTDVLAVPPHAH